MRNTVEAHIKAYPLSLSDTWPDIFHDPDKWRLLRQWSKSHPLHGLPIPLVNPFACVTRNKSSMKGVKWLHAGDIEITGDAWRMVGHLGAKSWWIYPPNINWEKITYANLHRKT